MKGKLSNLPPKHFKTPVVGNYFPARVADLDGDGKTTMIEFQAFLEAWKRTRVLNMAKREAEARKTKVVIPPR